MASIGPSARAYLNVSRSLRWLPSKLRVVHQAIWLGILDEDSLNDVTRADYSDSSGFVDGDYNILQGLWQWEEAIVRDFFPRAGRVLVAGAGGGREPIALRRLGFEVSAFDFSTELTTACRLNAAKAGTDIVVFEAPPDALPEEAGIYDAIYVGRGFYHHIPSARRRIRFLQQCRAHLLEGSPLFISDFFTRSAGARRFAVIQAIANCIRVLRRGHPVETGDWVSSAMQHAFVQEQIESELRAGGFRVEHYADSPFDSDSHLAHALGISAKPRLTPSDQTL